MESILCVFSIYVKMRSNFPKCKLPPKLLLKASIFSSELIAILDALVHIITVPTRYVMIYSDSLSVIQGLQAFSSIVMFISNSIKDALVTVTLAC